LAFFIVSATMAAMNTANAIWRACLCAGCLVVTLLGAILTGSPAKAQTDAEAVQQLSGAAQEILSSINQHRVNAGLNALVVDPLLNQAAQNHATDMMVNYNYSHRGSDGSSVKMRVARTGYAADPWVSENWVSSRSVDGAMRWWMNDYIHRVNILTGRWREIGVGIATRPNTGEMIFVTVFSTGRGDPNVQPSVVPAAQPAPAPAPLPAVEVPPGGMDYTIRPGDTLLGIAIRHNLDWRVVAAANGLTERSILQINQVIRLPGVDSAPAVQFDDDGTTGYSASTDGDEGFEQSSAPAPPPVETQPYTVQAGDTLFSIAARNGITWEELAAINNFREQDYLQIGQSLEVPIRQAHAATGEQANADQAPVTEAADVTSTPEQVDSSDALSASSNSTNLAANELPNYVIRDYTPVVMLTPTNNFAQESSPAQPVESVALAQDAPEEMVTAAAVTADVPPAIHTPAIHVVQPGDTIISIAVRYNIEWQALLALNGLNEQSVLQLDQEIRLR
jgi:LysM repeat protein/uncharacterized protein YkwD